MCDKKEEKPTVPEIVKFESKIVFALARLQSGCRLMSCNHNCTGVSSQALYEFIKDQYPELDGDIESQVITALQSGVRSGIICALRDGKYRLIGPSPKSMVSCCTRRISHGSCCCCLALTSCMTNNFGKNCCSFSHDSTPLKSKSNKEIQTLAEKSDECKKKSKRKLEKKKDEEDLKKKCMKNSKNEINTEKKKSDKEAINNKNKDGDKGKCDSEVNTKSKMKLNRASLRRGSKKFCSSCGKIKTIYMANKRKFSSRFS